MKFGTASASRWIFGPRLDLGLFIGPAVVGLAGLIFLILKPDAAGYRLPWLALAVILFADKGHVYVSVFRTYLDREELSRRRVYYVLFPALYWVTGFLLFGLSPILFWSVIVYLGFFHVVRQQYGWMVYTRSEIAERGESILDSVFIYLAALIPLLIMHCDPLLAERGILVAGDSLVFSPALRSPLLALFGVLIFCFTLYWIKIGPRRHLPKAVVFYSTAVGFFSYFVFFGSPAVLTVQPLLHGLPYLFLVYRRQSVSESSADWVKWIFRGYGWLWFCIFVIVAGFLEISLTSGFLSVSRGSHPWSVLGPIELPHWALAAVVPVITFPPVFHFITDGFLWRRKSRSFPKTSLAYATP